MRCVSYTRAACRTRPRRVVPPSYPPRSDLGPAAILMRPLSHAPSDLLYIRRLGSSPWVGHSASLSGHIAHLAFFQAVVYPVGSLANFASTPLYLHLAKCHSFLVTPLIYTLSRQSGRPCCTRYCLPSRGWFLSAQRVMCSKTITVSTSSFPCLTFLRYETVSTARSQTRLTRA